MLLLFMIRCCTPPHSNASAVEALWWWEDLLGTVLKLQTEEVFPASRVHRVSRETAHALHLMVGLGGLSCGGCSRSALWFVHDLQAFMSK